MSREFTALLLLLVAPLTAASLQEELTVDRLLMHSGTQLLEYSRHFDELANDAILRSNATRKTIKRIRRQQRTVSDPGILELIDTLISAQMDESHSLRAKGSEYRQFSRELFAEAKIFLVRGMLLRWQHWIRHTRALGLEPPALQVNQNVVGAHNVPIRSVSPKMKDQFHARQTQRQRGMSLQVVSVARQQIPEEIDNSSFSISSASRYIGHIEVERDENPGHVALSKLQSWRLIVVDLNGDPVAGARILFSGHMPGHVHGLPTQPRVTDEIAPGVYRISGVKFQMRGWWVLELNVEYGAFSDMLRFNLVL